MGRPGQPLHFGKWRKPIYSTPRPRPLKLVLCYFRGHHSLTFSRHGMAQERENSLSRPLWPSLGVTVSHFSLPLLEGETTNSPLPPRPGAAWASLFPAQSTIALKLLGCPRVQAASQSCLKMARCDEKHLIMAPKIHTPRIALHSWGKKSKRGPRTETLQVSPPCPAM